MRQMKTCINKIIYTSFVLGLAAVAASSLWSAQPKPVKATPGNIIVEIKKAEIKSQPTAEAGIIAMAFKGEIFKVLHELPGWYLIELSPGKEGYLAKKYARVKSAAKTQKIVTRTIKPILLKRETTENFVLIVSTGSYIRTAPAVNGKILAQAKINNAFRLIKKVSPDWYEAALPTGKKCYIPASVARIITTSELSQLKEQWKTKPAAKIEVPAITPATTPQAQPSPTLYAEASKAAKDIKLKYVSVTVKEAKLRAKASDTAKVISLATQGTEFKLVWVYKDWYEVLTSSGTAFISDKSASLVNAEETESQEPEKVPETIQPEDKTIPIEKPAEDTEETWLKDKYVLVTTTMVNVRESADKKGRIVARANTGNTFKLLARNKDWYEIFLPPDQNAFIAASLTEIITETDLLAGPKKWEETQKERQAVLRQAQEAQKQAQKEAERKSKLANEQEWLKDKHIIVTGRNINLRQAPNTTAAVAAKTKTGESFKLVSRSKGWYEVRLSSGVAFIAANLADIISEKELEVIRDIEKEATEFKERQLRETTELAKRQEAEKNTINEAWCKDKYVVVMTNDSNLRSQPAKSAKILTKAKKGEIFKILDRAAEWYEIFLPPDQNAFISISLVDILTEGEVESRIRKEREPILAQAKKEAEAKAQKLRAAAELKERQEVLRQAQEAKDLAQKEAERKSKLEKLEAEQEAAEQKVREEAERKLRLEKEEAEAKAKEIEWLKDKYVLVEKQTSFYPAPNIKAAVSGTATPNASYKIVTRTKKWYGIDTSSGTAFVLIDKVKLLTEQELTAYRQQQEQARQEKLKKEAAEKTKKEEELNAKLEAERKAKEFRETAELAKRQETERQEAETKAKKESFVQDKYILLLTDNTNLRSAPNKSSPIITRARSGEYFKLVWIAEDDQKIQWYQVDIPSGKQIIKAYINSALAQTVSKAELDSFLLARQKEKAEKPKLETQLQPPSAAEPGPKETELITTAATEKQAEAEWLKDKYVLITINNTNLRQAASKNAAIISKAKIAENYKLTSRTKDWYEINVSSGTAFVNASVVKVVTEQELAEVRQQQEKEKLAAAEAEQKKKEEAEQKAKAAAELKAKQKAETDAKIEAERQAKIEVLRQAQEAKELAQKEAERKSKLEKEETAQKAAEEKARLEAETKAKEDEWLKDKYILITINNSNLRVSPNKNSNIISKVPTDQSFKLAARVKDWYQIDTSSGTLFISTQITKVLTSQELTTYRQQQEQARQEKIRLETEAKAKQEVLRQAQEAKELAQKEAERKSKLEAAEQKTRELREATELAKRQEAEAFAREQEWLKDKYILIINPETNIRKAPAKNAEILAKAIPDREYKLFSRSKNNEWYEIVSLTGTGFVNAAVVKLLTEQELIALRQQQEQTRLETLKKETEAKAQREAELQAKLEKARNATAEQAKQIEEARAKESEWLKDKYILVPDKNISLRTVPASTANLLGKTSNNNESFKLLSRADRGWYQIQTPAGTAFIAAAATRVMSDQELNLFRVAEQKAIAEAELQAKLAAEEKARKETETKAAREAELKAKIEQEQIISEKKLKKEAADKAQREIERQAKLLREATELAQRQEAELKAQQTAEIKARLENESKAKMEAYVVDKYVLVTGTTADLKTAASLKAKNISRAKAGESFKVSWIENEEWFRVITNNGQTAFLTAATVKLVTEKELSALHEAEAKARLEAELQAKEAAALKEKLAAQEKAGKEAALISKLESDRQAREEKLRQQTEAQSRLQAERQARLEAEQKVRELREAAELAKRQEAEQKATEEKAKKEAALKAQQEAEQKARAEAERKARETAEAKARIETEAKAKMEAYVKDKYIVIADNNAAVRIAPDVLARILYVAEENESFKLQWIRNSWYEIKVPSGTALATGFVNTTAAKSMTMTELAAWQKVQEQERLLREAEELKARQQAELIAKELREATELAKRQEAECKAKEVAEALATEQEWLKDRYVLITTKDTNIRMKASKNADIVNKAPADKDYKLISRSRNNEWYEIDISSGPAFVNAAVVKVITSQELAVYRQQQEQARLEKAHKLQEAAAMKEQQAAEERAKKEEELKVLQEAERKHRLERQESERLARIAAEQKAKEFRETTELAKRQEAELKAKLMAEEKAKKLRETAELAKRQEAEQKAAEEKSRLEAEQKAKAVVEKLSLEEQARMEATAKARTEAEQKAKAEEAREDQAEYAYIIINASYAEIKSVPDLGAPALLIALKGDIFKYNGQQKGWYNILTFSGETRFVRKSLCRGTNIAPPLVKDESQRKDIYDSLIDAKDRAMSEANQKYPSIKNQSELQEKIFYQQTVEEKFILEVFHKYKIQPATYLTLLSEAISKNW